MKLIKCPPFILSGTLFFFNVLTICAQDLNRNTDEIISNSPSHDSSSSKITVQQKRDLFDSIRIGVEKNGQMLTFCDGIPTWGDCPVRIGDLVSGGIVFYIDSTGRHGLVASLKDLSNSSPWEKQNSKPVVSTDTIVGCGKSNTHKITSSFGGGEYAAQLCEDLVSGGFSDWFLPSINELELIYQNNYLPGVGNFSNGSYWSSSQDNDSYFVLLINFKNGSKDEFPKKFYAHVRAVRHF